MIITSEAISAWKSEKELLLAEIKNDFPAIYQQFYAEYETGEAQRRWERMLQANRDYPERRKSRLESIANFVPSGGKDDFVGSARKLRHGRNKP